MRSAICSSGSARSAWPSNSQALPLTVTRAHSLATSAAATHTRPPATPPSRAASSAKSAKNGATNTWMTATVKSAAAAASEAEVVDRGAPIQ